METANSQDPLAPLDPELTELVEELLSESLSGTALIGAMISTLIFSPPLNGLRARAPCPEDGWPPGDCCPGGGWPYAGDGWEYLGDPRASGGVPEG
jgi:hypothetical protein